MKAYLFGKELTEEFIDRNLAKPGASAEANRIAPVVRRNRTGKGFQQEVMKIAWQIMKSPNNWTREFPDCIREAWRIVLERESDIGE